MDVGFETVGNATLIAYDKVPVLATDPWLNGAVYFGSWALSHAIPAEAAAAVQACKFVWISHGHPDHLSPDALETMRGKHVLLADHVGKRIYLNLRAMGYTVSILTDRKWVSLSKRIRVMAIADYNQDSILLADINGRLVVNVNDAGEYGWGSTVRKFVANYPVSFQLRLSGFGDSSMINLFTEQGELIPPIAAARYPVGKQIAAMNRSLGTRYFVPFSSMHRYQRTDSAWANQYVTQLDDYERGFDSKTSELLPAFIRYDCRRDRLKTRRQGPVAGRLFTPEEFGDNWSDVLSREDVDKLTTYFKGVEHLANCFDYLNFRVGGRDNVIELGQRNFKRAITFEAPRHSLMTAINYEVFDDILIANFMKATLHGNCTPAVMDREFAAYVGKYADNGMARSSQEVELYFEAYRRRAPFAYLRSRIEQEAIGVFRDAVPAKSPLYKLAKNGYHAMKLF